MIDTHDGAQVLELALGLVPHIIILDVNLPHVSGWDVINQLQAEPTTAAIPIIVYTGSSDHHRAAELDLAAFIVKPATPRQVIQTVRRVLAQPDDEPSTE